MVRPRKIMADCEMSEFEGLIFLYRIVKKVYRRVCHMVLSERDTEIMRFVRIETRNPSL